MGVVGFQDFWIPGTRVMIQKEAVPGANPNPLLDIGLITSATPTFTPTVLQLQDSDGGSKALVDEALSENVESYEIITNNMNLQNLAMLFMDDGPELFTQVKSDLLVTHYIHPEHLVKILDASGTPMFNLHSINGVMSNTGAFLTHIVTDIVAGATQTVSLAVSDGDKTLDYATGDFFILTGERLDDPLNAGTYTVLSSAFTTFTKITIDTTHQYTGSLNSSQASISVGSETFTSDGVGAIFYLPGRDWEQGLNPSVQGGVGGVSGPGSRGYFRITEPDPASLIGRGVGLLLAPGNVRISYTLASGGGVAPPYFRQIRPNTLSAVQRAKVWLYISRENDAFGTVREFDASITPSALTLGDASEYASMAFNMTVVQDLSSEFPSGRIVYYEGDRQDLSTLR